jgi:DNA polymerase
MSDAEQPIPGAASIRDALEYFADLGFEELLVRAPPVARPRSARAEPASGEGAADTVDEGDAAERRERLAAVREQALACTACALASTRTKVVFGSGNPDADLMFIGEAPGYNEDQQGLPFVGAAGELLTRIIGAIGLERDHVYIANVVKCRPPSNRDPEPREVAACSGFLRHQIQLVRPRVIVALGRIAAQTLLASTDPVGRLRGAWHELEGVPLRVTYHPAALLRDASLKRATWEDMQIVRDRLGA